MVETGCPYLHFAFLRFIKGAAFFVAAVRRDKDVAQERKAGSVWTEGLSQEENAFSGLDHGSLCGPHDKMQREGWSRGAAVHHQRGMHPTSQSVGWRLGRPTPDCSILQVQPLGAGGSR